MPIMVPARIMQSAVAMVTAARHLEEPGGKEKLRDLCDGIPLADMGLIAVSLARMTGFSSTDEQLQDLGLNCSGDEMILL